MSFAADQPNKPFVIEIWERSVGIARRRDLFTTQMRKPPWSPPAAETLVSSDKAKRDADVGRSKRGAR